MIFEQGSKNGVDFYIIDNKYVSKDIFEAAYTVENWTDERVEEYKKMVKSLNDVNPTEWDSSSSKFTEWGESIEDLKKATKLPPSMKQDWYVETKDIPNYEGLYAVSKLGEVISWGNKSNHKEPIVLSPSIDKEGYKRVTLQKNGKKEYYRVCRLVATAFCENPFEYDNVNHIDKDKSNDQWLNLEWVSVYQNWKHSEEEQMYKEMPVIKLSLDGDYICEYKSLMDAARDTGINQGNITNCLKGRCKTVGGFRWIQK